MWMLMFAAQALLQQAPPLSAFEAWMPVAEDAENKSNRGDDTGAIAAVDAFLKTPPASSGPEAKIIARMANTARGVYQDRAGWTKDPAPAARRKLLASLLMPKHIFKVMPVTEP